MLRTNSSLETVYRAFHDRLRKFVVSRVHDPNLADDILQEVFLRIHSRIDTLEDPSKLESWLYQITRNIIVDTYRTSKRQLSIDHTPDVPEPPSEEIAHRQLAPCLRFFIDSLPPLYREVLHLVEIEGLSQKDLAEQLGISYTAAKSRVQRGRALLRERLMECCHIEFDRYGTVLDYHPRSCPCCAHGTTSRKPSF
jgi:RNA polymerase sigma-70 factor (ECF subfamily)